MIIFLDIDGVLNNSRNRNDQYNLDIDPRNISILRRFLLTLDSYEIVISSDWKYCKEELSLFSFSYGIEYKDCTEEGFDKISSEKLRKKQIQKYIDKNNIQDYIIIDDLDINMENHIMPDARYGLTQKDIDLFKTRND